MNKVELTNEAKSLAKNFRRINNWIKENPNTDPNCYELTECLMNFGNLVSKYGGFLHDSGVFFTKPEVFNDGISNLEGLNEVAENMREMLQLRGARSLGTNQEVSGFTIDELGNGYSFVHSDFFLENDDALAFFRSTYQSILEGDFAGEDILGKDLFNKKKEVLCKIASVYFYCWQVRRKNPNYVFDNEEEIALINQAGELNDELLDKRDFYFFINPSAMKMRDSICSSVKSNNPQAAKK